MATEYRLSYSASEINEKLGMVDSKQSTLTGTAGQVVGFDESGNATAQDAVQPDWNQNDETAVDYVKNRTHWAEMVEAVLFDGTVTVSDSWNDGTLPVEIVVDTEYIVVFNGVTYTVIGMEDIAGCPFIGNPAIWWYNEYADQDNGLPFAVGENEDDDGQYVWFGVNGDDGDYSLKIIANVEQVHPLDQKYIPNADWSVNDESAAGYIQNRTHYNYIEDTEILEEQTVTIGENGYVKLDVSVVLTLDNTHTYIIEFNGERYECIAWYHSDWDCVCIGNGLYVELDETYGNNEPFCFCGYDYGEIYLGGTAGETHTIRIVEHVEILQKLDPMFLPNEGQSDWAENDENSIAYIKNRIGGYKYNQFVGSLVFTATAENTLQYTIDADEENCVALFNHFHPNNRDVHHLAIVKETGTKRKFYWTYGTHGIYWCFRDENGTLISEPNEYVCTSSGSPADGSTIDITTTGTYTVGSNYTVDIYTIEYARIELKYLDETIYSTSNAPAHFGTGTKSHAEGINTTASGSYSHAEGSSTTASGSYSHAEGKGTIAYGNYQHTQGKYNIEDSASTYAHIVGNGTSSTVRSNAHTLDWGGNAWFAGTVEGTALILASSTADSTKKFKITVDDNGTLTATEYTAE